MDERQNLIRLAALIVSPPGPCAGFLDQIEGYTQAQLAGADYRGRFPELARHLDQCVACAESYALVYADLAVAAPAEGVLPAPDLSFLEPGASGPLSPAELRLRRAGARLRELLGGALERAGATLRLQLSPGLLAAAAPPPPALAYRAATAPPLHELTIDRPAPGIAQLQLSIYAAQGDPSRCDLRVSVSLPDREWPDLAGVAITLRGPAQTWQIVSDPWGEAVAAGLPADIVEQLIVEVEAPEQ